MNKLRICIMVMLAIVLTAGIAQAQSDRFSRGGDIESAPGYGRHMGPGRGGYGYGPRTNYESDYELQQRKKLDRMWENHIEEIAPLRRDLDNKYERLNEELFSENPDQELVNGLVSDINDLRSQLFDKSVNFKMEAYQKTGIPYRGGYGPGFCPGAQREGGYGPAYGPRGYGRGMGRGMMGPGPGYGPSY